MRNALASMLSGTVIIALAAAPGPRASAQSTRATETALGSSRCPAIGITRTDEAGEPLEKSRWYASHWRCPGYKGLYVYIAYGDQREGLAFGSRTRPTTEYLWPGGFGAWGPTVEWRGGKTSRGSRAPLTAIIRYSWSIDARAPGKAADTGADLAVIRVGRGRKDTCIVAWVDVSLNRDALALARRYADSAARDIVCARLKQPARLGRQRPD
ncbi:MAG: hypothetical protein KDJ41_16295 [Hyphomicrobiaceae bacterium]|nr:hypothetical protein [Hyphomicrobiaceae bacterium]